MKIRGIAFENNKEKARYMSERAKQQSLAPEVRALARRLRGANPQITAKNCFAFVQKAVSYRRDPGGEILENAKAILERGFVDCDGKALLLVALLLANQIDADILPVFRGDLFPHVLVTFTIYGKRHEADPSYYDSPIDGKGTRTNPHQISPTSPL